MNVELNNELTRLGAARTAELAAEVAASYLGARTPAGDPTSVQGALDALDTALVEASEGQSQALQQLASAVDQSNTNTNREISAIQQTLDNGIVDVEKLDVALDGLGVARRPEMEAALETVAETLVESTAAKDAAQHSANLALTAQSQLPDVPQFEAIKADVNALKLDPANGVTSWTIQAKSFDLVQGVPIYGAITGRLAAWQFPLDTAAYVSMPVAIPSHWSTMDIYAQWVNQVANSGNVVLGGEIHQWAMGETINTTPVGGSGIFSASASPWIPQESKIAADLAINPAKNTTIRIARQGASASDTLPNSIAILAVRLVKKS